MDRTTLLLSPPSTFMSRCNESEASIRIPITRRDPHGHDSGKFWREPVKPPPRRSTKFFPEDFLGPAHAAASRSSESELNDSFNVDDASSYRNRYLSFLERRSTTTRFSRSFSRKSRFASLIHDDPEPGSWKRGTWGFFQFSETPESSNRQSIAMTIKGAMGINTTPSSRFSAATEKPDDTNYPSVARLTGIMIAMALTLFIVSMDETMTAISIPSIASEFNSVSDIGWYGSSYLTTACAAQLAFGKIYRTFPAKWTYAVAVFIYAAGAAICATAPSSGVFILGRAISGLGFPGITAGSFILISQAAVPYKRPALSGFLGVVAGIGIIFGPIIGGAITTSVSWRLCFYIKLASLTFLVPFLFFQPNAKSNEVSLSLKKKLQEVDWIGIAFLLAVMASLLLALYWGGDYYQWSDPVVIILLVASAILAVAFVVSQVKRPEKACIPIHVIKQRSIAIGCAFSFCLAASMAMLIYYIPFWFQRVQLVSALDSGIRLLSVILGLVISPIVAAVLVAFFGYYSAFMVIGSALLAVAMWLITMFTPDSQPLTWIFYLIFAGCAGGLAFQQPLLAAQVVLPSEDIPAGITLIKFSQSLGGATSIALAKTVFANLLKTQLSTAVASGGGLVLDQQPPISSILNNMPVWSYLSENPLVLNSSIVQIFFVSVGLAGVAFFLSLGMEFRSTKRRLVERSSEGKVETKA